MSFLSSFVPELHRQKAGGGTGSGGVGNISLFQWGTTSLAGETVSPASAAQVAAVFCGVKIIAETLGMISLDIYKRNGANSVELFPKHPLQFRLHDEPNDDQTAMEWRAQMTAAMVLWGNGYSQKITRGSRLAALKFKAPQATSIRINDNGSHFYRYFPLDGRHGAQDISSKDMFHPKTLCLGSSLEGVSPIVQVRNAIGLAMALERFGSRFFANGAVPGGILMYPEELGDEGNRNVRESWKKLYGGADNSNELVVLEEGMTYQQVGTDPDKAQATQTRSFQIKEVARALRIPPHMLYETDQDSHNTQEQQALEFVTYTLMPWIVIWEQALNRSLLAPDEKGKVFCGFNLDDLLKGDMLTRYQAYAIARNWGWMTANNVLRREHMNPREDEEGDAYLQPMNMASFGEDGQMMPMQQGKPGTPGASPAPSMAASPNSNVVPTSGNSGKPKPGKPSEKPGKKAMEMIEKVQDIKKESQRLLRLFDEAA